MWTSVRDILLVARFEVMRAIRTWRAMALFLMYGIASGGGAYTFTRILLAMENALAVEMGSPKVRVPGAMLGELMQRDSFRSFLSFMVGSDTVMERILDVPVLAVCHLALCFALTPFFAAGASAECISIDMGSRALRFEVLRTGRLELVSGRYVGQMILTGLAIALSVPIVWGIGLIYMTGNDPVELGGWLAWLSIRAWAFGMPFIGLGVAASQLTTSPAWARVMAIGATLLTWVTYTVFNGLARWESQANDGEWVWLYDAITNLLPQGWMHLTWSPTSWPLAAGLFATVGVALMLAGYAYFARRDL